MLASAGLTLLSALGAIAAPAEKRATSCTVTTYSQVASAVSSCTAITISSLAVPAGDTLGTSIRVYAHVYTV